MPQSYAVLARCESEWEERPTWGENATCNSLQSHSYRTGCDCGKPKDRLTMDLNETQHPDLWKSWNLLGSQDFCLDLKIGNQDFETIYPVPETVWHENSRQAAFYSPSQEFCKIFSYLAAWDMDTMKMSG